MKSTHLRKRIVAALLAVVLAVSLAAPSLAIEETGVSKSGSNGLTWEEIDSSSVQVESPIQANTGVVEKTVEHEANIQMGLSDGGNFRYERRKPFTNGSMTMRTI